MNEYLVTDSMTHLPVTAYHMVILSNQTISMLFTEKRDGFVVKPNT